MHSKTRPFLIMLLVCFGLHNTNVAQTTTKSPKIRTIIIDAGHGGSDVGARGAYSTEAQITLQLALRLDTLLRNEMPETRIVMTRTTDIYHHVREKADIANNEKGDLFVCIHVNAAPPKKTVTGYKSVPYYKGKGSKRKKYTRKVKQYRYWTTPNTAKGTETFIYGVDKSNAAREALSENEDMYMDSVSMQELKDFNPTDPAKMMIINMKMQAYFSRSASLALTIEEEFAKVGRVSRDAKQRQKGIWVLQAVAMPAVLVETGFISNPEEELYLNSTEGQMEICQVLVRSIKRYRYSLDKQLNPGLVPSSGK